MNTEYNYRDYYLTDKYKGFYRSQEPKNGYSRMTYIAFSNGEKTIVTSGIYPEDAMLKAFLAIDQYLLTKAKAPVVTEDSRICSITDLHTPIKAMCS